MRNLFLVILGIGFGFWQCQAQVNYTIKDGLPSNFIYRITQDHKGFIWIITDKGISKFDGHSFKNFSIKNGLPTNDIWNIRITNDDKVWYFYKGNQLGYIENDKVYSFPTENDDILYPIRILTDGNSISLDVDFNIVTFEDSIWKNSKVRNTKNAELRTIDSQYIMGKSSDGTNQWTLLNTDLDTLFNYSYNGDILYKIHRWTPNLFVQNNDNELIIISANPADKEKTIVKTIRYNPPLLHSRTHYVNDGLQITGDNFLRLYDAKLNIAETLNIPEEFKSHFSFKDNNGFIWLATFDNGIYKLPKSYHPENTLTKSPVNIIKTLGEETFVMCNDSGIFKLKNGRLKSYFKGKHNYFDIYGNTDDTLINTLSTIYRKNDKNITPIKRIYGSGEARFTRYYKNILFSSGFNNVQRHNPESMLTTKVYTNPSVRDLFVRKDTLFSFHNNMLMYYDIKVDNFLAYSLKKPFSHKITSILEAENETYLGIEDKGVWLFKNRNFKKLVNNDDGFVTSLKMHNKNIWGLNNGRLVTYTKNDSSYIKKDYNYINGVKENEIKAIHIEGSSVYLGSNNGLERVSKTNFNTPASSTIYIKQLQINQQEVESISYTYSNDTNISLDIGAIDFFSEERNTFQYRLMPIQSEWVGTNTGAISFFDLQPNNYTLTIRRQDNLDLNPLEIPINISPRWNQRLWFKVLSVLCLASLAVALGMWLSKRRNENRNQKVIQEKELAQLQLKALRSQMNPHFVFNSLNAIQYFINQNDTETSDAYLVKFSRLIRQFFELSKEQKITVKEEIALLDNYLQLEQLRFKDKLSYHIIPPKDTADLNLNIPTMLIQPIVENAVNHGIFNKETNGNVTIDFERINKKTLEVTITDDGVGMPSGTNKKSKNYTSKNLIKDRLYHLNTSGLWTVSHHYSKAFPTEDYPGHKVTFSITSHV